MDYDSTPNPHRNFDLVDARGGNALVLGPGQTVTGPIPSGTLSHFRLDDAPPLQTRASGLGYDPNFNASAVLARRQEYQVQVIATTFSSVSILAAVCAIYWFCMMRRNFRRDLVLLLICGDFWKALWFLVFSIMSLSQGKDVPTASTFCQASGFLLQEGLEACDVAIFLMSLHMQLQIFPPRHSFLGHDGLYRVRKWALALWLILPIIMASLAFVNSGSAFISQGGFCSLPIRPFWYRLALSWIPRYLIWAYIMFVAIRIYRHVGFEFKVFGEERDGSSSVPIPSNSAANTRPSEAAIPMSRQHSSSKSDAAAAEKQTLSDENVAPEDDEGIPPHTPMPPSVASPTKSRGFEASRRLSFPGWSLSFGGQGLDNAETFATFDPSTPRSKSNPSSRRGSKQIATAAGAAGAEDVATAPHPPSTLDQRHRVSISTMASMRSSGAPSTYEHQASPTPGLDTITEHRISHPAPNAAHATPDNAASRAMQSRRRAITRQLRLLFIYPVVYMALWVIPFVNHALLYSNKFAQHPIFAINCLNIFCQTIMGFADVTIFCWREKPWRHIPGSDGTFLGSLCFWRFVWLPEFGEVRRQSSCAGGGGSSGSVGGGVSAAAAAAEEEKSRGGSEAGFLHSLRRWNLSVSARTGTSTRGSKASLSVPASSAAPTPTRTRPAPPPMHRRTHSGGSDRRILEAERAHERLAMERADYAQNRRSLQERRASAISAGLPLSERQTSPPPRPRKEWWDRRLSASTDTGDDVHDISGDE